MHEYVVELLECPACHGELRWTVAQRHGNRIETAEARCAVCHADYVVREGIGVFLTPDLPRDDLWEQVDSALAQYLKEHPDIERKLMDGSLKALYPTDQLFRAMMLEERGEYARAKAAEDLALPMLYTPEYLACNESQIKHVLERLAESDGPVVDLASGRCYLVEAMARKFNRPIVATDFSPRILRHDRRWLEFFGLYEHVSLLAFDVRRTPFKAGAVKAAVTNLGLQNIRQPGSLAHELRRIVDGVFLAISHFYPEDDEINKTAIQELDLASFLYWRSAIELFEAAGFNVELENICVGRATPTAPSTLIKDARPDALPVAETMLEWCVLEAR
jgi:uncharacterized protein YbaR (Trm112 family)